MLAVNWESLLYGFQFKKDCLIYDDVGAEAFINDVTVPVEWDWDLRLDLKTSFSKFIGQDSLVNGLQKPGPQCLVNSNTVVDDGCGDVV